MSGEGFYIKTSAVTSAIHAPGIYEAEACSLAAPDWLAVAATLSQAN
jgi:hypothetical protein